MTQLPTAFPPLPPSGSAWAAGVLADEGAARVSLETVAVSIQLSCTYTEFQTYQTCLAGLLDFDTMRFNWRMTFLHGCLSILSY